jgi:hypothetical protein
MQLHKSKLINEDIRHDLDGIYSYFEGLEHTGITCRALVYRIQNELSGRIDALRQTMEATLRSYLSSDARLAIESWSAQDKNRFFDANIIQKVNWAITNHAVSFPCRSFSKTIAGAVALVLIGAAVAEIVSAI